MKFIALYQKSFLLLTLLLITYFFLVLETIKYPGLIANHFYIDTKVYFATALLFLIFQRSRIKLLEIILKLNRLLLPAIFIIYLVFIFLEGSHYTNYVLSKFHFHLEGLIMLVIFSYSIFLIEKFRKEIPKSVSGFGKTYTVITFLIIYFIVKNLISISDTAFSRGSYILSHLQNSYDDKMTYQWGIFYKFMVFVRNNTPSDATIVIPPEQDPWLMGSGNDNFVRAFLYPRKIVTQTLIIPEKDLASYGPNTFILVTWGKESCRGEPECHGWPRQDIKASKIIYKDPDSSEVIEVKQDVVYKLRGSQYVYGIIELKQ